MEMKNKPPAPHWHAWLHDLPIQDPVNRRMAALVQVMLIGFIAIIILASILNIVLSPDSFSPQIVLIRTAIFVLIIGIPLFLLRRGQFRSSVLIIIAIFLLVETFAVMSTSRSMASRTRSCSTIGAALNRI